MRGNKSFWVVAELVQGHVRNVTYELLGRALELATKLESELCAVLLGDASKEHCQDLIAHGADRVYVARHEELLNYSSDAYAALVSRGHPEVQAVCSYRSGNLAREGLHAPSRRPPRLGNDQRLHWLRAKREGTVGSVETGLRRKHCCTHPQQNTSTIGDCAAGHAGCSRA